MQELHFQAVCRRESNCTGEPQGWTTAPSIFSHSLEWLPQHFLFPERSKKCRRGSKESESCRSRSPPSRVVFFSYKKLLAPRRAQTLCLNVWQNVWGSQHPTPAPLHPSLLLLSQGMRPMPNLRTSTSSGSKSSKGLGKHSSLLKEGQCLRGGMKSMLKIQERMCCYLGLLKY